MIQVGIHENLVITKAIKNDKGSLVIGVKKVDEVDPIAVLEGSNDGSFDQPEQDFLVYPPKVTNFQGEPGTAKEVLNKIAELKAPLNHILSAYLSEDKRKWNPFAGTKVSKTNMETITDQSTLDKIYDNIVTQFITMITPFMGENGKKVRMLFIRQSEAKHFPTFRKRYLEGQPFIEPMEIPKAVSKLAFSKYEISKGLNNPNPAGGAQTVSTMDARAADALFV